MRSVVWLMCASLLGALAMTGDASAFTAPSAEAPPQQEVRQTYARVVLTLGDKTYKHPGFFAYCGEEAIFDFEIGGKVHEISVGIEGQEDKGYDLDVLYKKEATMVVSGKGHVKPGASLKLEKGTAKVEVFIDPHGQVDKGRRKKIGGPDSDDPLG